jgi:predicted transcriptional regulator
MKTKTLREQAERLTRAHRIGDQMKADLEEKVRRKFDRDQKDLTLSDTCVEWQGQFAVLLTVEKRTELAYVSLNARTATKLMAWCVKNHYRCSSIRNGRINDCLP